MNMKKFLAVPVLALAALGATAGAASASVGHAKPAQTVLSQSVTAYDDNGSAFYTADCGITAGETLYLYGHSHTVTSVDKWAAGNCTFFVTPPAPGKYTGREVTFQA
jgi:hypothetical protein